MLKAFFLKLVVLSSARDVSVTSRQKAQGINRRVTYCTADLATTGAELTERAECVSAQDIIKHI